MKLRGIAVAAIVLIAATVGWHARRPAAVVVAAPGVAAAHVATAAARVAASRTPLLALAARRPPLPTPRSDSLRDTSVDGVLHLDRNGAAVADRDLRRLFDYFLARLGERDVDAIRADVLAHLRDTLRLDANAQAQVLVWFDAYVAVTRRVAEMARSGDLVADAAQLRALHRRVLGTELAQAWFGADDDYAAYTAQRLALERDASLSVQMKSQRRAELESVLDPAQLDERYAATDFQMAVTQSRDLDAAGADAAVRFADRAALWGDAAATRLAALDQAEAQWDARVARYAQQRVAVLAEPGLTAAARAAQLDALLAPFGEAEQRRLLSLAQVNALPGAH